jgi:hypothetical protein
MDHAVLPLWLVRPLSVAVCGHGTSPVWAFLRTGFLGGRDFRETIWAVVAASDRRVQAVWAGSQFIWRRSVADVRAGSRHLRPSGRAGAAASGGPGCGGKPRGGQSSTGGTRACHGKDQHAG